MRRLPGMFKRPGADGSQNWYYRKRVPQDLLGAFDGSEIKRSLRTPDLQEAISRAHLAAAEMEQEFENKRRERQARPPSIDDLSETEIERMVMLWFRQLKQQAAGQNLEILRPEERQETLEEYGLSLSVLDDPDHPDALIASQAAAHRILMQHGFKAKCFQEGRMRRYARTPEAEVDTSSPNFWKLCDLIQRGLKRITEKALSRLEGKSTDPFFDELDRTAETARPYAPEAGEQSLSLNQIFEEWVEDRKPSEKTRRAWAAAVRRFGEVNGDLAVASITTLHISKFKKALSQLPAKLPHHIRKMPVPEIIKATKGEGRSALSPAAVKKEIAAISSLMSWAVKNGYRGDNPAAGVEVPNANIPERERVPFSGDELSRIFRDLRKFRRLEPSKYWLPQLALMTGARQRELGQLLVEDVKDENGIAYIDIKKGEGKSLKTRSSARQVPLHPTLIKNGFLDYVEEQKERGERLLFPDLKPDTLGSPTGNFSKWFGRRLQKLGIRDLSKDERRDFHSLRHNFKEACRNARIEEEVHDALTGHAPTNVGRRYGGVPLELKATEIAKVQYLGLDLPPLCLNSEDPPDPTSERNGEVPSE